MTPDESKLMFDMALDIATMKKDIRKLCNLMTHADSDGFSRCAVHTEKLKKLENNQGTLVKVFIWAFILITASEVIRFIMSMPT